MENATENNMDIPVGVVTDINEVHFSGEPQLDNLREPKLKALKLLRNSKVSEITVTLEDGIKLDGDEESQNRIARAIAGLSNDTDTTGWIDANGNPQMLNRLQFKEALSLAGQAQTELFTQYAVDKAALLA